MRPRSFTILLVEDDPNDQNLVEMALRDAGATGPIQSVSSGEQAIAYLAGDGQYSDRSRFPYPSFVITDLKMPNGDGFSVLLTPSAEALDRELTQARRNSVLV